MAYVAKADKSHDAKNLNDTLDQGHPRKDSKLHLLPRLVTPPKGGPKPDGREASYPLDHSGNW